MDDPFRGLTLEGEVEQDPICGRYRPAAWAVSEPKETSMRRFVALTVALVVTGAKEWEPEAR